MPSWKKEKKIPYNQVPYCFTLDELMKGGSNEIHSIALRHMP